MRAAHPQLSVQTPLASTTSSVMVECQAPLDFLVFAVAYTAMAGKLADAVTLNAMPIGSGIVAGTERIPIHERAKAAVIAWMAPANNSHAHWAVLRTA